MTIESEYLSALELTHKMLEAAIAQDWDTLTVIEKQRARIINGKPNVSAIASDAERTRVAKIISEIERESAEIVDRAQHWQEDVKILLRMKQ